MKYVLDENGNIKIGPNGKPLVKGDDGKEFEIDAIGAQDKINTITAESNERRKKLGDANTALEAFGDLDVVAARKAIEDVAGMSDKGKADLETQRAAINKTWQEKEQGWKDEKGVLTDQLFNANVGNNFATSKVVLTTVLPPDIAKATFGKHFKADGSAVDASGNAIYSREKPGEPAGFDEALTILIDAYPGKKAIMKATSTGGSGGEHSNDGGKVNQEKSSTDNIKSGLAKLGVGTVAQQS